ncbi:MAG TPA: hypothetical protein VG694_03060, partial [Candidatus Paceibacterota bacterium]|nr:hypothetical protein [Candidatus Paceibacterota bacterium]
MSYSFLARTRVLSILILIFALVLVGRLFLVQVIHGSAYAAKADHQYATPSSNIFERGTIFFQSKDGQTSAAAVQAAGYKIAIDPEKIADPEAVYKKLSAFMDIDHDYFIGEASRQNDPYEEVAHQLSKDQADKISAMKITGVSIFEEKWRFYPGGDLASHTLGFVGYQGDQLGGRYGLERQYDGVLAAGADESYVNFFAEVFSNIRKTLFESDEKNGDIETTIEPTVQSFLEKELEAVKQEYNVDSVGGIIMNPADGSIYAMSAKPDFDPNNFS